MQNCAEGLHFSAFSLYLYPVPVPVPGPVRSAHETMLDVMLAHTYLTGVLRVKYLWLTLARGGRQAFHRIHQQLELEAPEGRGV